MIKDYYQILQIPQNATDNEIKKSYRILVLKYHPDKNLDVDEEIIKELNEAYDILSNIQKRKLYDLTYTFNNIQHGKDLIIGILILMR